ncbi:AMP-binding protein [Lentzea sp. NPDC054927]
MSANLPDHGANGLSLRGHDGSWHDLPTAELPPHRVAVIAPDHLTALAAVWTHHRRRDTELLVVPATRFTDQMAAELTDDGFAIFGEPGGPDVPASPGRVWVSTSGSSGRPKRIAHTLTGLTTVTGRQEPRRWLLPFTPGTYAWWQLVMLSLSVAGQDLVTVEPDELSRWTGVAAREGVTAVSATPTFWRHCLLTDRAAAGALPLAQITLGGEPVDQRLLDDLTACFPDARISWIYASTETGAAFAVHDAQAGFPVAWLDSEAPGRPRLRVDGGELLVHSPYQGVDLDGFVRTGDRTEIRGDRVHITGRLDNDQLNVGGAKISAAAVRQVLTEHPRIAWARVHARRAPVVGQLVTAQVVASAPVNTAELTSWCADRLPDHAVPRLITFLDEISVKEGLKSEL